MRVDIIVDADCPLPAAIISANTDSNNHDTDCEAGWGDDIIILPRGGTTTLTESLNITDNLTINGNGHIISGGNAVRVISARANLTLTGVTIRDGRVSGDGAGIYAIGSTSTRYLLTIDKSAFINNQTIGSTYGGAIFFANTGAITIRNSTFSGNSGQRGSALFLYNGLSPQPQAKLIHVTVAGNTTRSGASGGAVETEFMPLLIRNSIIANNAGKACFSANVEVTNSIIEGTNDCGGSPITSDPALGSLTGSPAYYPLGETSPAIGAGDADYCTATDQRGQMRPQPPGTNCDIGAYENTTLLMPVPTNTATNTPTATYTPTATATNTALPPGGPIYVNADCPLPAAVIAANTDSNDHDPECVPGQGDDEIILPLGGTTTLSATLNITSNITFTGNGHTISGNDTVRVIDATANLTLNNVTIRDGRTREGSGGGIQMKGTTSTSYSLTINNSAFINNRAGHDGGGLLLANPGPVTISNSTFSGNDANSGGAMLFWTATIGRPVVNLIHVTVSDTITRSSINAAVVFQRVQRGAIRNSIIANNRQQPAPALSNKACAGVNVQITNSIIEGTNDCGGSPITSDPALSGLTGSPAYFPLGDNSPALGAGHITYCTATDQRGESRPQPVDSNCDIGAFEHLTLPLPPTGTPTATYTPTSTPTATYTASATLTLQPTLMPGGPIYVNADCPLPAAVTAANTDSSSHDLDCVPGSGDDEIILPSGGGTTTLTGTLNISSNITITGNGHIISGGGTVRVISIGTSSGRLTLNNVTIENGWATGGSSFGGAIRITAGALTVNNSTFKNNRLLPLEAAPFTLR